MALNLAQACMHTAGPKDGQGGNRCCDEGAEVGAQAALLGLPTQKDTKTLSSGERGLWKLASIFAQHYCSGPNHKAASYLVALTCQLHPEPRNPMSVSWEWGNSFGMGTGGNKGEIITSLCSGRDDVGRSNEWDSGLEQVPLGLLRSQQLNRGH